MKKILFLSLFVLFFCVNSLYSQFTISGKTLNPCSNQANGTIDLTITGGKTPFKYLWNNGSQTKSVQNLALGIYSVTVTDSLGVNKSSQFDLSKEFVFITNDTIQQPQCGINPLNGGISVAVFNGKFPLNFNWSNGSTFSYTYGLAQGLYTLTLTDARGCSVTKNYDLSQGNLPVLVNSQIVSTCNNKGKLEVLTPPGTAPFTYTWKDDKGTVLPPTQSIQATKGIYYSVTVSDSKKCVGEKQNLQVGNGETLVKLKILKKNNCANKEGIIGVGINNNKWSNFNEDWKKFKFSWSNGVEKIGDTTLTEVNSGKYKVEITTPSGCSYTDSISLYDYDFDISLAVESPCLGNGLPSAEVVITQAIGGGPYLYMWDTGETTREVKNLTPFKKYTVEATDSKGCKSSASEFIYSQQNQLSIYLYNSTLECDKVNVNINGGVAPFTYSWSNGMKTQSIYKYLLPSSSLLSVTVTDSKGCKGIKNNNLVTYNVNDYFDVESCGNQATVIAKCNAQNLTYLWDNGTKGITTFGLKNGTHKVTITDIFLNKAAVKSFSVNTTKPCNTSFIKGNVKLDQNNNCQYDVSDKNKVKSIIEILPGPIYGTTDNNGFYKVFLPPNNYQVNSKTLNLYEEFCANNVSVNLVDSAQVNFISKPLINCPYMTVNLATSILRRCFDNTFQVNYCNLGTATAKDALVKVTFDNQYMTYKSASIPLFAQNGGELTFKVGDVAAQECKNFSIVLNVNCNNTILGQTHCVAAKIYPDSLCKPIDNPKIVAKAQCDNQNVIFTLKNIGTKAMNVSKNYFVIEDEVIYKQGNFKLNPNESIEVKMAANGKTYRIQAEAENAIFQKATAFLEACGTNSQGKFSTGFVNMFSNEDGDLTTDVHCRQSVGSYDPNEKIAIPTGYKDARIIDRGVDLDYILHFQNEGTDTAFTVILRDDLDKSLDVNTLRAGASSHPYDWKISGTGLLEFTFNKINLTTKKQNEALSQGFVSFKIAQKKDLPLGTIIKNQADIYFDFNPAIKTNQVFHTIGKDFIKVTAIKNPIFEKMEVNVYPNPTDYEATFDIRGIENQDFKIKIFDISGKLQREEKHNQQRFIFKKESLQTGIYFYQIESNGQWIANGKLIIL